ncbi:unnamed protein product, partial [Ixodes pacificus]
FKLNAYGIACSGVAIFVVLLLVLLSGEVFDDLDQSVPTFDINLSAVVNKMDRTFLGAGLDSSLLGEPAAWGSLTERFENDSLMVLLKSLAPAVLRFSGYETDHFYFVDADKCAMSRVSGVYSRDLPSLMSLGLPPLPSGGGPPVSAQRSRLKNTDLSPNSKFPLTGSDWLALNQFVGRAGWSLLFSLNAHRLESDDPSPSPQLTSSGDLYPLLQGLLWQLGEAAADRWPGPGPSPYALACEYEALHDLLAFYPATLVGPGVSTVRHPGLRFLDRFLRGRGRFVDVVSLRHVLHEKENVTLEDILDPAPMEKFASLLVNLADFLTTASPSSRRVWLSALSTTRGAVRGVSGTFAAMLAWVDAFGAAAKSGITAVLRNVLLGAEDAFILTDGIVNGTLMPLPDFWVTLLIGRHVGRRVLAIERPKMQDPATRIYVHCAREHPGGLAFFGVRLADTKVRFKNKGSRKGWKRQLRWVMTADGGGDLSQSVVKLNGRPLEWRSGSKRDLPDLSADELTSTIVVLPAWSMVLTVFPDVGALGCG